MSTLSELLSSQVKAEIFRLLFGLQDQELHVREIERQSGLADATVRQELKRLTRLGLVERRQDGNRVCYQANRQHPLYLEIHNLVLKTTGLVEVLHAALASDDIAPKKHYSTTAPLRRCHSFSATTTRTMPSISTLVVPSVI